jgi:hypothetical protein
MCWVRGVSAFFESEVPFSFSNGDYMADWIVGLASSLGLNDREFRIKEYGAGLGVLASQIVSRVQDLKGPSGWTYTVSEYSAQSIDQLTASTALGRCAQVSFCVEDITKAVQGAEVHDLIILNYLLDSLPTDQLVWKDGQFFEILVSTAITGDQPVIDSVHFPPRFVMPADILPWLKTLSLVEASFMAPAISTRLKETFELGPVNSVTAEELVIISSFLTEKNIARIDFNYPLGLLGLLDRLWDELSDTGAVWIFDMADVDSSFYGDYAALTVGFRGVICFPLWVDFITWYWSQKSGVGAASQRRDGRPVGIVLSKQTMLTDADLSAAFSPELVDFGEELEIGLNLITDETPNWETKLRGLEASVPSALKTDYHVCMHFALKWSRIGRPGETLDWLTPIFRRYRDLAIAAKTLAARSFKLLGNQADARHYLLDVIAVTPDCAYAYKELSLLALKDQDWVAFKQFAIQSVQHGTQDLPWNLLLSIGLLTLQAGNVDEASKLLRHLNDQIKQWPDGFEIGFQDRVRSALGLIDAGTPISL